jgi:cold shock CspA family protein
MQRGGLLYFDRVFDDILMSEGVTTHYLPVKTTNTGTRQEKGIDVWLALEAFELAFYKQFNVLVLITSDGDYVPLIRKLNTLGTRVMVLSWDFEFTNDEGQKMTTRTSQYLLEEVTYPLAMHSIIDSKKNDRVINNMFIPAGTRKAQTDGNAVSQITADTGDTFSSEIQSLKSGYGFIKYPPNNLFFHYLSLVDIDFNDLHVGDKVSFSITKNDRGEPIAKDVRLEENRLN